MMNPKQSFFTAGALLGALALGLPGCSGEPEGPPPAPAYVPPPPAPDVPPTTPISDLMAQLRIDPRVSLPEDYAPDTDEARKAVLEFFDAFARGDSRALARKLSSADQRELQAMVESGEWERTTSKITRIDVQTGMSTYGECALALFDVAGEFQPQLWYYTISGDSVTFDAAATPPNMVNKLSGTDWIKAWHSILDEERELAARPDTPVQLPQRNLDEGGREADSQGGGPTGPAPGGPTGPASPAPAAPGGNDPPPRRAPGIPIGN